MKTYTLGRADNQNIIINEPTISRKHLELIVTKSDKYYVTDCRSSHGTRIAKNGKWEEVLQEFVTAADTLLVGRYKISVEAILAMAREVDLSLDSRSDNRPIGSVERDPETGEPIQKLRNA